MSTEASERSSTSFDKKRRMSLKGPPLRVALKQTASAQPSAPAPVSQRRPSMAPAPVIDRRLSISAKKATQAAPQKTTTVPGTKPTPVEVAPVDPMIAVNARLETIERQISELQQSFKQIALLEAMVKPMKTALDLMQSQVNEVGESVQMLQKKKESKIHTPVGKAKDMQESTEELEDVSDVLEELNQSLDSGEIDMEAYGSSLRFALGYDGKMIPKGQMSPMMTSTPIVKRSLPRTQQVSTVSTPMNERLASTTASAQKMFVHEKTPIKKPPSSSFLGMSYQSLSALSTPAATPVDRVTVARVASQLENVSIPANQTTTTTPATADAVKSSKSTDFTTEMTSLPLIEPILESEKANVSMWLGLEMSDLNQAIPLINQFVQRKRLELCASGTKEAGITVDEVASVCEMPQRRAKGIVLLLCTLKRLKLVRGETLAYSIVSGNSLKQ